MEKAELFWITDAQQLLQERVEKGEFVRFAPRYEGEIIVVGGRCTRWNEATWNKKEFVFLPHEHRLSYLIALETHIKCGH